MGEKLSALNEKAKNLVDREIDFVRGPLDVLERFVKANFGPEEPFNPKNKDFPYGYKPCGNHLSRPLIDLPLYMSMTWFALSGPVYPMYCQIMERDYMRCVSRVGLQNSDRICRIYWEDLRECVSHSKSEKRAKYLKKVRDQKGLAPMDDIPYQAFPKKRTRG